MALLAAGVLCSASSSSSAAPSSAAPLPRPPDAVSELAGQLAARVLSTHVRSPVAVSLRAQPATLQQQVETVLIGRLASAGLSAFPLEGEGAAAEARARSLGAEALLRLEVGISGGRLAARGDLLGTHVNFWAGALPSRPASPALALDEAVPLDASVLALTPTLAPAPAPDAGAAVHRGPLVAALLARLPEWTQALAAGDVDGDGREEVVALTLGQLRLLALDGRELGVRELGAGALPPRDPNGAVAVYSAPARIAYWSAVHGRGEQLRWDRSHGWALLGPQESAPFGAADLVMQARATPGQNTFAPAVTVTRRGVFTLQQPFVTLSAGTFSSGPEGLAVFPGGGGVKLHGLPPRADALTGLGAGSTLVDLDADGRPELATSSAQLSPEPDEVRVLEETAADAPPPSRVLIPRGRILQLCPVVLEGNARALVVATWLPDGTSELWIVRRTP